VHLVEAHLPFLQVKEFLQHFWKGVPLHLMDILGSNAVINMVGVCDSVLYQSVAGIFVPSIHKVRIFITYVGF
jgi:regulatory factor X 4